MTFSVAVLGATGYIGSPYRREIRDCRDEAQIVALCARRMDRLEAAAEVDGAELITADWRRVVEHPTVDLVLVCTPDALHHEAVVVCAERGLHVLCEKPVGANAAEARQMWDVYRDSGLGHFVPFWTRYVDLFRRAREVVESGELGQIRAFVYRWHNPRPVAMPFTWRDDASLSSAGSIADVGSHAYDTLRWILGDEAERVLAHADVTSPAKPDLGAIDLGEAIHWGGAHEPTDAAETRPATAFDYASIAMVMRSGCVGTIVLSHAPFLRKGLAPELELHGKAASLSLDRISGELRLYRPDAAPETVATLPDNGLGNRFHKFVFPALRERIADRPSQHPGLDDGYRVQMFTDAAARSAAQGTWAQVS